MKPSISTLPLIAKVAYESYTASRQAFRAKGFDYPYELPDLPWESLPAKFQEAFQSAAYAAIIFLQNPLLPISAQSYNGYVMKLEEAHSVKSWIDLDHQHLQPWHEFGVAARNKYQSVCAE